MKVRLKKLTIIAEQFLRPKLIRLVHDEGARGHTLTAVEGEGSRGVRASEWEGRNIQIDTIVSEEVADRILERLEKDYFHHYAVIAFVTDVEVLRGEKFAGKPS